MGSYTKMIFNVVILGLLHLFVPSICGDSLPTSYEYYTSNGINSGLSADQSYFILNGKNFSLYSGAMHYFRVPRAYWRDRLKKIRAAGLNTVETYIAWNMHEYQSGVYDFGNGGSDNEDFLHLEEFIQTAQEEDLFVLLRPGPYICAEYNFGGFPSWLLRENSMGFRTEESTYLKYVERYFNILLPMLKNYQFTNGGPVIAFQVENEYGWNEPNGMYFKTLTQIFRDNGIVELLVVSDNLASYFLGTPEGYLQTINLGSDPGGNLDKLLEIQPNRPPMVMEFWSGWFDYWSDTSHSTVSADDFKYMYEIILTYPASVNIYMFHGGTNFGSSNGASFSNGEADNSGYQPYVTSYDYDAPLNEGGDYTDKYFYIKDLLDKYNPIRTYTPDPPDLIPKVAYPSITIEQYLPISDVLTENAPYEINSETVIAMELLDINDNSGQSVGYTAYRKENVNLEPNTVLKIEGHICDTAIVLVNGVLVSPVLQSKDDLDGFGFWRLKDSTLILNTESVGDATVDIIVEEWGRANTMSFWQYNKTWKGLWQGDVYLNDNKVSDWKIIPLEFKKDWTNNLEGWTERASNNGPGLYLANLDISSEPSDTYIDMRKWTKGTVFVNGFALGKYALVGPQQALYLPAPFLKTGTNKIVIFEHFKANDELSFVTKQIWN